MGVGKSVWEVCVLGGCGEVRSLAESCCVARGGESCRFVARAGMWEQSREQSRALTCGECGRHVPLDHVRWRQEHQAREAHRKLAREAHLTAQLLEQIVVELERALSRACVTMRERLGGRWISHHT